MKVNLPGGGQISLGTKEYVAQGGEGSIYVKGKSAYKIYADPRNVISIGKIQELSEITDPCVIKPEKILTSTKGKPVGYSMRFLDSTWPLCQVFTRSFRERNGISPQNMMDLVLRMRQGVENIHKANVLIVDLNEMNFLVDQGLTDIYFIDVDSYQTPHYPATALMESVRDRHSSKFSELTDWFSFGVVSFQMMVGIHPFKGKHPDIKGFDARMKDNISVFNPSVRVPKVCYSFDAIPDAYRSWYKSIFEDGNRIPPPEDFKGAIIIVPSVRILGGKSDHLIITEVGNFDLNIIRLWEHLGSIVAVSNEAIYLDNHRKQGVNNVQGVGFTPRSNRAVIASREKNIVQLRNATDESVIPFNLSAQEVMSVNERIYIRNNDKILEILLNDLGGKIIPSTKTVANVLGNATHLYQGVAIQDLLGSTFVSFFPRSGSSYQVRIKELDDYRIVDAKSDKNVLMILGSNGASYDRLVFRFDDQFSSYDLRKVADVDPVGLNFISLDTGISICLNEDENLEIFSQRKGSSGLKIIEDNILGGDMSLITWKNRPAFLRDGKIYEMTMK